jgi:hypothetical protein
VCVWPPIVTVAVRDSVDGFDATLYTTLPGPVPPVPAVIVVHVALAIAVQAQDAGAVTVTLFDPPSGGKDVVVGVIV